MAAKKPAAGGLVELVALVTIYASDPEPAAPGSIVLVPGEEALTLIERGHARLPEADAAVPSTE